MHDSDIRQLIARTCEFPAESDTVVAQLGDVELEAPTGKTTTVAQILERPGKTTYHSPDGVYTAILGNLDDAFIGRKYYDDRTGSPVSTDESRDRHSL